MDVRMIEEWRDEARRALTHEADALQEQLYQRQCYMQALDATEDLVNELRTSRATVCALCVLLGMAAEKYPATLTPQFIRECVDLKQVDELKAKEGRGVAHIAGAVGPELFARLVELYEAAVADDP